MKLLKLLGICLHDWDYSKDHDEHYNHYMVKQYKKCNKCYKKELIFHGIWMPKYIEFHVKSMDKKNEE